jgi:hypothetical protein
MVNSRKSVLYFTALKLLVVVLLCIFLFSCKNTPEQSNNQSLSDYSKAVKPPPSVNDDSLVVAMKKQVLTALKNKDFNTFATYVHPTLGVRFSPYAFVDTASDLTFQANDLLSKISLKKKIHWGPYSAGEEEIMMTVEQYFARFIYNADFLNAEKSSLNEMIGGGTTTNNLVETYKNCPFTESYFSGFEKKFDGMDWCSLRLVFKKHEGKYYLVGIVHDEWTT